MELLEWVIPLLTRAKAGFRIIKNQSLHYKLNCGYFGNMDQAKAVSIYPESEKQAWWLVWNLRRGAFFYKGPTIPTARRLANILHADFQGIPGIRIAHRKGKAQPRKEVTLTIVVHHKRAANGSN